MKVLIITGKLAYPLVKEKADKSKVDTIVHIADNTQVAAFLTPNKIIKEIKNNFANQLNTIDFIIAPGLMRKSTTEIKEVFNIPTFKGSTDAADLQMVLDLMEDLELSEVKAADRLIEEEKRKQAFELINNYENDKINVNNLLKKSENILVKNLPVGEDFPMRVLSEIANAPALSKEDLIKKAEYFIASGSDMIDIGMLAGEDRSEDIPSLIDSLRPIVGDKPLSIDTLNPKEIKIAVDCGIDMVLSLDHGNCEELLPLLKEHNVPAVLLPTNYNEGFVPHTPKERIDSMKKLIKKTEGLDIIADMVLDPINSNSLVDSITAYNDFHKQCKRPMFFGIGNVIELMDTDSVGANAVLSGLAMELGASILFTPEESAKTAGSVHELAVASKMMFLAKKRHSIPKDLGIDLLVFKDKRKHNNLSEQYNVPLEEASECKKFKRDPKGSFKIRVSYGKNVEDSKIIVTHFTKTKPDISISGSYAKEIYDELVKKGLVTRLEHAAYLGSELEKAEIAMITGKDYIQDFPLFNHPLKLN